MKIVENIASRAFKKSIEVTSSLQRQAPGARMIGEFAVKQATKEVEKLAYRIQQFHSDLRQK
jgi:hypothetical protein